MKGGIRDRRAWRFYSRLMGASLSLAERRILEAADEAVSAGTTPSELTDVVRRSLGQIPGPEFRRGVAALAQRGLLRARFWTKVNGDVGRVVIEQITPLGRSAVRARRRPDRSRFWNRAAANPQPQTD